MLKWSQFHDFEGADQYSARWAECVRARCEETADISEFLKQRADRSAKEANEALERARRLRKEKEEAARGIRAELDKARAEEEAAAHQRSAASAPVSSPTPNRQSRQWTDTG